MTVTTIISNAQSTLFVSLELEQLRAELTRERAQRDELAKIITTTEWPPAERVTMATLLLQAWANPANTGQWALVADSAASVAKIAGLSESTANNVVRRLKEAGLVERTVERGAVNRYGEPVRTRDMNVERGDRWENTSTIAIVSKLPDTLPALTDTIYSTKQRAKANEVVKLAKIARELQAMPCPHCGTIGELHLGCSSCNHAFTVNELDRLAEATQNLDQNGVILAQATVTPMTDEQQRVATHRRRMRDVRGVPSTPGMSVTYEHFDDEGIDISMKVDSPTGLKFNLLGPGTRDPGPGTGDAEAQNLRFSYHETQNLRFMNASIGREDTEGGNCEGPAYDFSTWGMVNHE